MKKLLLITLFLILIVGLKSQDTFSICAIDTITGEVGSAGASCVYIANQGVMILSDVHPGIGVIHTQASYLSANQEYARSLMTLGLSPQQIIDSLIANDAQGNPTTRQYGIVDFRDNTPRSAAYTGINCLDYKNHITGPNYSIQGNILLGQQILDSMESRFLQADGELACRLMEALQGAKVVGADTRCMGDGISSIGSFLRVAKPGDPVDSLYLQFNIPKADEGVDPIDSLQVLVDQWGGCITTGLTELKSNDINFYPNPVSDLLYIDLGNKIEFEGIQIEIRNIFGQLILLSTTEGLATIGIYVKDLTPGLYIFSVKSHSRIVVTSKFIVR